MYLSLKINRNINWGLSRDRTTFGFVEYSNLRSKISISDSSLGLVFSYRR